MAERDLIEAQNAATIVPDGLSYHQQHKHFMNPPLFSSQISSRKQPHSGMESFRVRSRAEEGFLLVAVVVMAAILLIYLAVAAPIVAKDLQRERELETVHRGQQYVRAIRVYYRKFNHYPTSIEQLDETNNIRFLRQHYLDPMTGKDDWRIIHVGENQTKVTGFFGEPLAGLDAGGLGSAAGMASGTSGTTGTTGTTGGTTPSNPFSALWGGSDNSSTGSGAGTSSGNGTTGGGTGGGTTGSSGVKSTDATDFGGSGGGPIMGVSSQSPRQSILIVHKKSSYNTWEFIYDPRIEMLYAKATTLGGGGTMNTNSSSTNGTSGASGSTTTGGSGGQPSDCTNSGTRWANCGN